MRKNIPPLHLILAFDAVARFKSFKRAADELSVSYSTISHRIRDLEQALGVTLFTRTTRSVNLAPDGSHLYEKLRDMLEGLSAAFSTYKSKRDVVRISVLPSFARLRLLSALEVFSAEHPEISIEISSTTNCVDVDGGETDIAVRFACTKPQAFHPSISLRASGTRRMVSRSFAQILEPFASKHR